MDMMMSSNGNIFCVTGPLWGESTGHWCLVMQSFDVSLICFSTNGWANNRDAGDLRHHRAHNDITVMEPWHIWCGGFLAMDSANERRCYIVTPPLIGWAHTKNDPCNAIITEHPFHEDFSFTIQIRWKFLLWFHSWSHGCYKQFHMLWYSSCNMCTIWQN